MLIDPNIDEIEVGGDDLTQKNKKKKKLNFNGTQIINFGSNNFISQEQKLNVQYGISPKNQIDENTAQAYNTNNYKTNKTVVNQSSNSATFGLGQLKKKQMIAKPTNFPQ